MRLLRTHPTFGVLLLSNLLNAVGGEFYNLVFIVYAQTLPFRQLAVSIASAAWVAPALTSFLAGHIADRTRRKTRAQLLVKALQTLIYLAIALLIGRSKGLGSFLLMIGLDLLSSAMEGYASSLWMPVLKHLVPASDLQQATSLTSAVSSLAAVLASSLGALVLGLLGNDFAGFSLVNAGTFLLAGLLIAACRRGFERAERPESPDFTQSSDCPSATFSLAGSWQAVRTQFRASKFLTFTVGLGTGVNMIGLALTPLLSVVLVNQPTCWWLSYGTTIAGITASGSIGLIAGALFAGDPLRRLSMATLLTVTMACASLCAITVPLGLNPFTLFAAIFAMNYLLGKVNPRFMALLIQTVPEQHLAATMGAIQGLMTFAAPLGQFVFLLLANLLPGPLTLCLYAGCSLVLAALVVTVGLGGMNAADPTVGARRA
ncbi:MFS transporter [Bombiscardovia nodaiensis]|uniref:MFS transporter n=1 Tax=Bombiscardovia nodaiensis TaxID=2932181 RepID=A0ABN6SAV6_9BIFI|nr:MFS transporter [Bombiscardovia nodaiensis]